MAGQIAEAYVQIIPTTKGIASGISKELGGEGESGGKSFGKALIGAFRKFVAVAGIGKIIKSALDEGGAIQQSFGGLETIYGDAANAAKDYAKAAYDAGISANNYAEQAVSFGAALKQAYGGDAVKAMEAANTAIMDMADNSAKMGTDIASVQAAYQGFAKQNYTMLDNLKLGYGGTKTEMERLLADATALSGIEYNIDNLGDVYDAIHVIQGELGLTCVAAMEAKTTLTGSFGAMKAAAQNFLADLALGNDVSTSLSALSASVVGFARNVMPMITSIIAAAPQAILELLTGLAPMMLTAGIEAITALTEGLSATLPGVISTVMTLIPQLASTVIAAAPQLLSAGTQLILSLMSGFLAGLPSFLAAMPGMITQAASSIRSMVGTFVSAGVALLQGLVQAIPIIIPALVSALPEIVMAVADALIGCSGDILSAAATLFIGLVVAVFQILAPLNAAIGEAISNAVSAVVSWAGSMLAAGATLVTNIVTGIVQTAQNVYNAAMDIGAKLAAAISGFAGDMVSAGANLLQGVATGIGQAVGSVVAKAIEAAQQVVAAVKSFFGIASPSKLFRDEVGNFLMLGLAEGIEENTDPVSKAIDQVSAMTADGFKNDLSVNASLGVSTDAEATNDLATLITLVDALSAKLDNLRVYLDGDTLVGGIAGTMDNALGDRSRLVDRGLA